MRRLPRPFVCNRIHPYWFKYVICNASLSAKYGAVPEILGSVRPCLGPGVVLEDVSALSTGRRRGLARHGGGRGGDLGESEAQTNA